MANTYVKMQEVSDDFLIDFQDALVLAGTLNKGYEGDIMRAHTDTGGTVDIRKRVRYNVKDGASLSGGIDAAVEKKTSLTIDKRKHVAAEFTMNDFTLYTRDRFRERFVTPMARHLANYIDSYIAEQMAKQFNYYSGEAAVPPATYKTVALARSFMNLLGIPRNAEKRWLGFTEESYTNIISAGTLQNSFDQRLTTDINRDAQLGRLATFQTYSSETLYRHESGQGDGTAPVAHMIPLGTVKTNVVTGNTIVFTGFTLSLPDVIRIGDKILITHTDAQSVNPISLAQTGKGMMYTSLVDAAADGSGDVTVTVSPSVISAGTDPYRNISNPLGISAGANAYLVSGNTGAGGGAADNPYETNLCYIPSAGLFAAPPLAIPSSIPANAGGSSTDPDTKISIRMVQAYDIIEDREIVRADIIFGLSVEQELGIVLLG